MTFRLQDAGGTIEDANAYSSVAFVRAYHLERGTDLSAISDSDIEVSIVQSTDFVDYVFGHKFTGNQKSLIQGTLWPRLGAYDKNKNFLDGSIPIALQKGVAEYTLRAITAEILPDPVVDSTGKSVVEKKVKIDILETVVKFDTKDSATIPRYPKADNYIKTLLTGSGNVGFIVRA